MEEVKHLPPKFSFAWRDLANYYNIFGKQTPGTAFSVNSSDGSIVSIWWIIF